MRAARVHRYGAPDVIEIEDVEEPRPGEGEVLVRVQAAGVGPWDAWIRAGKSVLPQPLPLTLGADLSGVVEAVGPGVTGLAPGDAIYGVTNERFVGAYAELAVVRAAMIARKPDRIDHVQAASVPVVAVTALQMLFDHAGVRPGQRVLVHGAGGNVGAYAVQLAHQAGAHVIGTVVKDGGPVRSLGADAVIDHSVRFENAIAPVHAVIDLVGGEVQQRSFSVLEPGGALISAVSQPDPAEGARRGVRARFMLVDVGSAALARIATMIDAGKLATRVGPVLPLAAARVAHELMEGSRPRPPGKIVLETSAS